MSKVATLTLTLMLGTAFLSGCGSDDDTADESKGSGGSSGSSASKSATPSESPSPEPFDLSAATLTTEPFCDRIDTSAVAEVLGMPGKPTLVFSHKVGDKYKTSFGTMTISPSNQCGYADSKTNQTKQFGISVHPRSDESYVKAILTSLKSLTGKPGQSDKCTVTQDQEFGDPGAVVTCAGTASAFKGRAQVEVVGLVGETSYFCSATIAKGSSPKALEQPVKDLCLATLEDLATT